MAFTFVTITHEFDTASDTAAAGSVEFLLVAPMHNGTTTISAAPVISVLAGSGIMTQVLAANTDPGTQPGGTTYQVTEKITGQTSISYFVQVPHDQGSTLNLRDLTQWVGGSGGETIVGVSSINGETGDVLLAATDIGAQPLDSDLTAFAGLNPTDNDVAQRKAGAWTNRSPTQLKTDLVLDQVNNTSDANKPVSTATTTALAGKADTTHIHSAADLTSGTVATARLGSGTASSTTFLRGDQTYAVPAASYTSENARDDIAAALVAGTNVTITPNDGADTITIAATGSAEGATFIGTKTITGKLGINVTPSVKQPINFLTTHAGGSMSGSQDKIGFALGPTVTGNFSADTGSNPGFFWGMNVFTTTGSAAGDGAGLTDIIGGLIEMSVQTPSGTTLPHVIGFQAEAAFFGASSGATVTQMESMRVSAPKRKDGASTGTATNVYGLFIESVDAYNVGATNKWALFVEGGVSRLQGRVDVDSTVLSYNASLSLQGDYSGAGKIQLTTNNIGFFGVTPVARQSLPASGSVTAANIRTALIALGLCV